MGTLVENVLVGLTFLATLIMLVFLAVLVAVPFIAIKVAAIMVVWNIVLVSIFDVPVLTIPMSLVLAYVVGLVAISTNNKDKKNEFKSFMDVLSRVFQYLVSHTLVVCMILLVFIIFF